ncbi:hypothetical protein [Bdellovibrio sp. NC01]|uniref:hypothetical protein n=1 Tax=Bdellovibrio sp. NC01 TaxID=2220073 RepID=UPI001157842E|nr:hypothetical protein [Bdellovibrio sp. NC01]QDK36823.1 hypothetical protein DOE51_04040 [Bdellovibrio sp. NC01]
MKYLVVSALILMTSLTSIAKPLDAIKEHSFENVRELYSKFSDAAIVGASFSASDLASLKRAGYEVSGFTTPTLAKVSTTEQTMEFSINSRKYSIEFKENGSAHVNGLLVDVTPYRDPVERIKYVERALRGRASLWSFIVNSAYAATEGSPTFLVERLLEKWNQESKKWVGSRLYDTYVKKDGVAELDKTSIATMKQLFSAKDLVGIEVKCQGSAGDVSTDSVQEGGASYLCNAEESARVNAALYPRVVKLYHEDGSVTEIIAGVKHPSAICTALSAGNMPAAGVVVKIKNGKVSSETAYSFPKDKADQMQEKAVLPEERAIAAAYKCCDNDQKTNCFDKMVQAAEKSKLAPKGTASETLRGSGNGSGVR